MKDRIVARAFTYVRPYWISFTIGQIAILVASVSALVFPMVSKYLVDSINTGVDRETIYLYLGILAGTFIVLSLASYVKDRTVGVIGERMVKDVRQEMFEKIQNLSMSFFDRSKSGNIVSVMTNDLNLFQQSVTQGIAFIATQIISLIVAMFMLFRLDSQLTLVLLGLTPIVFLITKAMGGKVRKVSARVREKLAEVTSIIQEAVRGIDVIRIYSLERKATEIFGGENERVTRESERSIRIKALNSLFVMLLAGVFIVIICGVGIFHVQDGKMSLGDFVAYLVYAQLIVGPLGMLSGIYVEIQKAVAAGKRIFDLMDADTDKLANSDWTTKNLLSPPTQSGTKPPAIDIRNLSFRYGDAQVLNDVSIRAEQGESIALVGPSGAGKSTLLKLLLRFYPSPENAMFINGQAIEHFSKESLSHMVSAVMQDTHLFDMSLQDNILCGNPESDEREVERAARLAHAHKFIRDLPDKYQSSIGENGTRLSGGQRQRISIARAFLKNPDILLLDEATASLDAESEHKIQASLKRLMRGRTTVAIAHRLSTIKRSDRIYVMDKGEIVAEGTHEQLIDNCDLYHELCAHQMLGGSEVHA